MLTRYAADELVQGTVLFWTWRKQVKVQAYLLEKWTNNRIISSMEYGTP